MIKTSADDVIVVMICKNEKNYIREFVEYHLNLGFDRIVIGDNNDVNSEERLELVLEDYVRNDKVVVIDLRGKQGFKRYFTTLCPIMELFINGRRLSILMNLSLSPR